MPTPLLRLMNNSTDPLIKQMLDRLRRAAADEELRRKMDVEDEYEDTYNKEFKALNDKSKTCQEEKQRAEEEKQRAEQLPRRKQRPKNALTFKALILGGYFFSLLLTN
ncbi:MAG: hypothetical protein IPN94_10640 [Sphingobacteriales bacterium]|nr:hypothetical protein [Sphingobacteriales bacterium]